MIVTDTNNNKIFAMTETIRLKTGVEITQDKNGNIVTLISPYHQDENVNNKTVLRYLVSEIKKIIK